MELQPRQTTEDCDANEKRSLSEKDNNNQNHDKKERSTYVAGFVLFLRILPAIIDHLSDIPILITLWNTGYRKLFWLGLAIDLLPGPVTAYQFFLLGFKSQCALLLIHPINVFVYTFLALCDVSPKVTCFSRRVVAYCHECQALLESPMQIIFTTSLICHGILPLPWDKAAVISNSFGNKIDVSFFPVLSITFSLMSVVFNAGGTVNLMDNVLSSNFKRASTWLLFLLSSVLFRLSVWVILSTYLAEFVCLVLGLTFVINLVTLIFTQSIIKLDPLLSAIYSLVFPITFMKSVFEAGMIEDELKLIKKIHKMLALSGTALLGITLWIVYLCLPYLEYNQQIVLGRDRLYYFIVSTTLMGFVSVLSTVFISAPQFQLPDRGKRIFEHFKSFKREKIEIIRKKFNLEPNEQIVFKRVIVLKPASIALRLFLLSCVIVLFVCPFFMESNEAPYGFRTQVCGEKHENETFKAISYRTPNFHSGSLFSCYRRREKIDPDLGDNFQILGCLISYSNETVWIVVDKAPSTPLPKSLFAHSQSVILFHPNSAQIGKIKDFVEAAKDCEGDPALVLAVKQGNLRKVRKLLTEYEGDEDKVNMPSFSGDLALTEAIKHQLTVIFRLLLENNADPTKATANGWTPLHYAALVGNVKIIEILLKTGRIDINAENDLGETALFVAAENGKNDAAKFLFSTAEPRAELKEGQKSAIVAAAARGHLNLVRLFINDAQGKHPIIRTESLNFDTTWDLALINAAANGHLGTVQYLLTSGLSLLSSKDDNFSNGYNAVMAACAANQTETALYLIDKKRKGFSAKSNDKKDAIFLAAENLNFAIIENLIKRGASVNERVGPADQTPLHVTVADPLIVRLLLRNGADPDIVDNKGNTALHWAAIENQLESFELLLKANPRNIYLKNKGNLTPSHAAAAHNNPDIIKFVFEDESYNVTEFLNGNGGTVLHDAAFFNCPDAAKEILRIDESPVNFPDNHDFVPLHLTALSGAERVARMLIASGGQLQLFSKAGKTPLKIALESGRLNVAAVLLESGIDPDAVIDKTGGSTALHSAAVFNYFDFAKELLEKGAAVDKLDVDQATPLVRAAESGSLETAKVLLAHSADPTYESAANRIYSPLLAAVEIGDTNMVKLMLTKLTKQEVLRMRTADGLNPIQVAENYEYHDIVAILQAL